MTLPRRGRDVRPAAAFDLSGRVALVTGAGAPDGIGMATARLLGALGAEVAVAATTGRALSRAAELQADGVAAVGVVADLTDEDQAEDAVAAVRRGRWGHPPCW